MLKKKYPSPMFCLCIIFCLLFVVPGYSCAKKKIWKVVFVQNTMANDWRVAQVRAVEQGLAKYSNIDFYSIDAKGDTARSILDIERMIAMGIDILIASPRNTVALTPVLDKAYAEGIWVIMLSRRGVSENYTSYIHPDNAKIARQAAEFMVAQLQGKGDILILQGIPTTSTAIVRTENFLKVTAQYPDIHIAAIRTANYLRSDAALAVEKAITDNLVFDAIYAQSDSMASGARMAMRKAGLQPSDYLIVGVDYSFEARDAIRRGTQAASFTYPTGGKQGVQVILDIIQGKQVPKEIVIDSIQVTGNNVEQVKAIF